MLFRHTTSMKKFQQVKIDSEEKQEPSKDRRDKLSVEIYNDFLFFGYNIGNLYRYHTSQKVQRFFNK